MENEKLAMEALDEISGGADAFVEGFKSLSGAKKAAIIGGLAAILAGTAAVSYEAGTGGKHIKKLLGKEDTSVRRYIISPKPIVNKVKYILLPDDLLNKAKEDGDTTLLFSKDEIKARDGEFETDQKIIDEVLKELQ